MRLFFPRTQRILVSLAVVATSIYGISRDASAYDGYRISWSLPSFTAFMEQVFSFSRSADAEERDDDKDKKRDGLFGVHEKQEQSGNENELVEIPSVTPEPSFAASPTITPTPENTDTPIAAVSPSPTPTPEATPTPSPTPEQIALNIRDVATPAKKVIVETVGTIAESIPGIQAFKLGVLGKPYSYDGQRLDRVTTRKLYVLAGAAALVGMAMLAGYAGKEPLASARKRKSLKQESIWFTNKSLWEQKKLSLFSRK